MIRLSRTPVQDIFIMMVKPIFPRHNRTHFRTQRFYNLEAAGDLTYLCISNAVVLFFRAGVYQRGRLGTPLENGGRSNNNNVERQGNSFIKKCLDSNYRSDISYSTQFYQHML